MKEAGTREGAAAPGRRRMDESVWASHLDPWKPLDRLGLPRHVWRRYAEARRRQARGYWHGATAIVAMRLGVSEEEWLRASRAWHPPGWEPIRLGDASFCMFDAIVSRALEGDDRADAWLTLIRNSCRTPRPRPPLPPWWTDKDTADCEAYCLGAFDLYGCRRCEYWDSPDGERGRCNGPELQCGMTLARQGCEQFWPRVGQPRWVAVETDGPPG